MSDLDHKQALGKEAERRLKRKTRSEPMNGLEPDQGKKRKAGIPTGNADEYLVMGELLRRGFDAQLADRNTKGYDLIAGLEGGQLNRVQVKTVRLQPWFVWSESCRGVCTLPGIRRFGPEHPERAAGDEVTLKIEGVVNGSAHGQEALGRAERLEAL